MKEKKTFCDAQHWRRRAEATRTKAASLDSERSRDRLMRVAEEYERLARLAEGRQGSDDDVEC